ncbi:MAG: PAS domain S-box protein [Pseudomonadota bacterium]
MTAPQTPAFNDQHFRIFIESVRDYALLMLDPEGRIQTWNAGAEAIKGYKAEEIIGQHFSKFYPPDTIASGLPERELVEAARVGRYEDEGWRLRKDGSRFWANVVITALRDEKGALLGYAKVTRDLSERRRSEETLRTSEARFRSLIEGVRDYAIFMLDPDGHVATWNAGAEAIKGYRAEEIIGKHFSVFYPPEAIQRSLPKIELVVAAREGRYEDEGWRLRNDGSRIWANVVITALRNPSGNLIGFSKVTRDLSERRRHEEDLRASEIRFRALVEGVRDYAIFMLDPHGHVATWNAGAAAIKGYRANEIIGKHFSQFYPPTALADGLPERELRGAMTEGRYEDEGWRVRKDGTQFWANVVLTAIRDPKGQLIGFSKITRDLTDRRRHEEKLRVSEERFRLLVEGVSDYAIVTITNEGLIATWNSGAQRITGYAPDEIVGRHFSVLFIEEDVASNRPWQQLTTALETGRVADESWRARKDGTRFWSTNVLALLRDSEGRPNAFYLVMQDLTERRHAETLADTAQRMHEFIAMLAHELRNPLAPIRNAVTFMGRVGLKDPVNESMRLIIERQSSHLTHIVDELLDVNRVTRGEFSIESAPLDLRDALSRAIETSRPVIDDRRHTLNIAIPDFPIEVSGDLLRLTQMFVNILNNAAKYTADEGQIWLTSRTTATDVEVSVRDNGRGIAASELDRVFELFMQSQPGAGANNGGLGVGLTLVRRIAELHSGSVFARSAGLGHGSEFIVRLPLARDSRPAIKGTLGTAT